MAESAEKISPKSELRATPVAPLRLLRSGPITRWRSVRLLGWLAICTGYALNGCGDPFNEPVGPPRSYRMGLTPFAQSTDGASEKRAWDFVKAQGDLIALHIDPLEGLPWEALEKDDLSADYREGFEQVAARFSTSDTVYAAITPLNTGRDGVAPNSDGGPFPEVMGPAEFSNPRLRQAYLNYARFIVETIQPAYLAVAIEVNLYARANGADFESLVEFYKVIYQGLKRTHPETLVFVTFQTEFLHGFDEWSMLSLFEPELDLVGLSLYPSGVGFRPNEIPENWISTVSSVTDLPVAITETGYGTRPYAGTNFSAPGSEELQRDYVRWLVEQADNLSLAFVVWFFPSEVPDLLPTESPSALPPSLNDAAYFIHMGLVRSDFTANPAFQVWDQTRRRPFQP